jgi:hypothetical protein
VLSFEGTRVALNSEIVQSRDKAAYPKQNSPWRGVLLWALYYNDIGGE